MTTNVTKQDDFDMDFDFDEMMPMFMIILMVSILSSITAQGDVVSQALQAQELRIEALEQ